MSRFWRIPGIVLAAAALVAAGASFAADEPAMSQSADAFKHIGPQRAAEGPSPQQYLQRQAALHDWLTREIPADAMADPITVRPSQQDLAELAEPPTGPGPLKVGVVEQLEPAVSVSCRAAGVSGNVRCSGGGSLELTADGGFVWARSIRSVGATAIRLHVIDMTLPADADMFFYSSAGEAYGPYRGAGPNGDGDFWLPSVMGESGVLVVRHYGPNGKADLPYFSVTLSEIGHVGAAFDGGADTVRANGDLCPYNASCIQNATCQSSGPATAAEGAAAKMLWISGCCIYICTGGLIADTDSSTEIPYFLTANHCISKGNAANNLEAFFAYQMPCGGTCPAGSFNEPPASVPKTVGASIVSTSRNGDYTLLRLDQNPPSGSTYLGWNSAPIAFSAGSLLHRISHPSGAPQAYSRHSVNTTSGTCLGTDRGEFIYSDDVFGATEGGSSGSPVVNASGEIVGQLTGCCGSNCNNVCDSASNRTIDGALAFYFSNVESYLDPAGCTPTTASCSDGIDNDCDGATDCNDTNGAEDCSAAPECQSGGSCVNPGGAPVGSSCSSNSQCCSDKCKGAPGNQTCR